MEDESNIPSDVPAVREPPKGQGTWTFMLRRRDKAHVVDLIKGRVECLDADTLMREFYGLHPFKEWSPILVTYTEGEPVPTFIGRVLHEKVVELLEARAMDHKIPDELDPKSLCE